MMVATPDPPEDIRCGKCGQTNPPDAVECLHCGARLRPVTPQDDDLLSEMRARTGGADSIEEPIGPLDEPEPDFVFGSLVGGEEDTLPEQPTREEPSIEDALNWLFEDRGAVGPASAEPQPDEEQAEEGIPEWLSEFDAAREIGTAQPAAEPADAEELPEWLGELAKQDDKSAEQGPTEEEGIPDWLAEFGTPEETDKEQPSVRPPTALEEPAPVEETPEWLLGLEAEEQKITSHQPPPEEVAPETEPAPAEVPEPEEKEPAIVPPPLIKSGMPDWLRAASTASEGKEPEQPAEIEEPHIEDELLEETELGWLAEFAEEGTEEAEREEAGLEPAEAVPDWLAMLEEERIEETELEEEVEAEAEPDLARLVEKETAEEAETPPKAEPEPAGVDAVPGWLADLSEAEAEEPAPETAEAEAEPDLARLIEREVVTKAEPSPEVGLEPAGDEVEALPDWLAALSAAEAEAEAEEAAGPAPEARPEPTGVGEEEPAPVDIDAGTLPEWMEAFSFEEGLALPVDAALQDIEGEDLLGLSGELLTPAAEAEEALALTQAEESAVAEVGALPEWLRGLQEGEIPEGLEATEQAAVPEGLAEQIQDLRFEALTGEQETREGAGPEAVGALKDVAGVIQPELIFEGSLLSVAKPIDHVVVTEEQVAQIELVKKLIAREGEGVALSERSAPAVPLLRWGIALLLIFIIAIPLLPFAHKVLPLQAARGSPGVEAAYQAAESLTVAPSTVLVAFEYEPDTAAEMQPLAEALLGHLAASGNVTVYAVSMRPTGPAMAEAVFQQQPIQTSLAENGLMWMNLGYIPGRANGVSSLAIGSPPGVSSPLSFDYRGQPTGLSSTRLVDGPFSAIIVLAAQPEDLRIWVEQAGQPTGLPLLAGLSVRAAPLAEPYQQSGQVVAVLSGINDAVAYQARSEQQTEPALLSRWNAQAIGSLAAAVLIVLGSLVYGLLPRTQQEHDR